MLNFTKLVRFLSLKRKAIKEKFDLCGFWIMIPLDDNKNGPLESSHKESSDEIDFHVHLCDLGAVEYTCSMSYHSHERK